MPGGIGGRGVGGGWVGQAALGLCATGTEAVCGGRPTEPVWWPTSKVSRGPSRLPIFTFCPSVMSMVGTRRPLTNTP